MKITLARIDNRLMHGIVMTQYLPSTNSQRIMVIDDEVASDATKKQMMMMAKPNGYAASIITMETALTNIAAKKYEGQRIFLLSKGPKPVLEILKLGYKVDELIVGATDRLHEGIKLSDRAYITEEEAADFREILKFGTKVVVQHNPAASRVNIEKFIK